jgi:hypothetical protein
MMLTSIPRPNLKRNKRVLIVGVLMSCVAITGCGSSEISSSPATVGDETATAAPADSAAEPARTETAAATATGVGPAGIDITNAQLCKLVTTEDITALFGSTPFSAPGYSTNSCSLNTNVEGQALQSSLVMMPVFPTLAEAKQFATEIGRTVEDVQGIGDAAIYISGAAPGFGPAHVVQFVVKDISYIVEATFQKGQKDPGDAVIRPILERIARDYAATL